MTAAIIDTRRCMMLAVVLMIHDRCAGSVRTDRLALVAQQASLVQIDGDVQMVLYGSRGCATRLRAGERYIAPLE
jgi:hypothetical protein